ncbi:uncharacterized protein LOC131228968 isoform X2 [Magnolia sinica]|uniref:uncharacterized protein LOC131228968 isoform X2 n=1 Tax=Magnolia sinica TaxID=86752 RepID=UPI00265963C7|nr:uncharacterized protein LOC131228968 isoform X2 [Magnolia sinica]
MGKAWKIIPRPLLETILNNHAQHHRVHQPLIVHGPRGVGKTTLFRCRLLDDWNKPPHLTGYVDFGLPSQDQQPQDHHIPWSSWCTIHSGGPAPSLLSLCAQLERCLESMVHAGVRLGSIGSHQVFSTLNKWHGIDTALRRIIRSRGGKDGSAPTSVLWSRAIFALGADSHTRDTSNVLVGLEGKVAAATREEEAYYREAALSLRLAKEVIGIHQAWRANAVAHLNRTGGFSRSLANSVTDWPCLLVELLSDAAELDFFQPKLVINNIDVLRRAIQSDDSTVSAAMYHDSLLWRLIALGVNEKCLPVILVTSDRIMEDGRGNTFEDIVNAYIAYLQVTVVNPAMESALDILQKFAFDALNGRISKDRLHFGAPWRHPPRTDNPNQRLKWAKLQLMDFIQSLVNAEFGVNYLADSSLEILDDPSTAAMLEVGLLYAQRDPSFIRPITRGIERCLVRWLVQQRLQLSFQESLQFLLQRIIRGRSYRHLMKEAGYK